jgi:magnesium chelatase family protein
VSYARVHSAGVSGATGTIVEVEADVADGLPNLVLSGLPDAALQEARDRVRAAIVNSGEGWPQRRITVNLRPATVRKQGSSFDLGIAVALLGGTGTLPLAPLEGVVLIGELGLDGAVRGVRGVLPMVIAAARAGLRRTIVPSANASEAALVPGVQVRAADSLHAVLRFVRDGIPLETAAPGASRPADPAAADLSDVVGQDHAKLALEVAAAGGHHLSLLGPPGAGKTMLAQRMPTILPPLDDAAAMEVTSLYSVAGRLPAGGGLLRTPPFQAPHHTTSVSALVGGGSGIARPGALSLAHRGVLFLDELPEFGRRAL